MDKEYDKNQKEQKRTFKKYRKFIGKALLYGGIGLASALFFPAGVFTALKGLLGESIAMNLTFFTQWGIAAAGAIGAGVNALKAHKARKKIEESQDYEEEIIDSMQEEKDNLEEKVKEYEKELTKQKDNNKTNDNSKTNSNTNEYQEEVEENKTLKR